MSKANKAAKAARYAGGGDDAGGGTGDGDGQEFRAFSDGMVRSSHACTNLRACHHARHHACDLCMLSCVTCKP